MNEKLLKQLALAKEAGTKAMAKDFFAPVPGAGQSEGTPGEEAAESPGEAAAEGDQPGGGMGNLTPEQLEELMRALGADAGGGGGA